MCDLLVKVHTYLAGREDVSEIALAVVEDHIDVALLHSILAHVNGTAAATPKKIVIVGGQASLAAPAEARIYDVSTYYSWIFGILTAYDLADTLAAVLSSPKELSVLVLGPKDEQLKPLDGAAAQEEYAFASSVGGSRLSVQAGAVGGDAEVLESVLKWLGRSA